MSLNSSSSGSSSSGRLAGGKGWLRRRRSDFYRRLSWIGDSSDDYESVELLPLRDNGGSAAAAAGGPEAVGAGPRPRRLGLQNIKNRVSVHIMSAPPPPLTENDETTKSDDEACRDDSSSSTAGRREFILDFVQMVGRLAFTASP